MKNKQRIELLLSDINQEMSLKEGLAFKYPFIMLGEEHVSFPLFHPFDIDETDSNDFFENFSTHIVDQLNAQEAGGIIFMLFHIKKPINKLILDKNEIEQLSTIKNLYFPESWDISIFYREKNGIINKNYLIRSNNKNQEFSSDNFISLTSDILNDSRFLNDFKTALESKLQNEFEVNDIKANMKNYAHTFNLSSY